MSIENPSCRPFAYLAGGNGGPDGDWVRPRRYPATVPSKPMMGAIWLLPYPAVTKNNDPTMMRDTLRYFSDWLSGSCLRLMMKAWANTTIIPKTSTPSDSQTSCDDLVGTKSVLTGGKLTPSVVPAAGGVLATVSTTSGCANKQVAIKLSRMMMLVFMYQDCVYCESN